MSEDKVISFTPPRQIDNPLTEVLRTSAQQLLEQAIEAQRDAFLAAYAEIKTDDGRHRLVRHRRPVGRTHGDARETPKIVERCGGAHSAAVAEGA